MKFLLFHPCIDGFWSGNTQGFDYLDTHKDSQIQGEGGDGTQEGQRPSMRSDGVSREDWVDRLLGVGPMAVSLSHSASAGCC